MHVEKIFICNSINQSGNWADNSEHSFVTQNVEIGRYEIKKA